MIHTLVNPAEQVRELLGIPKLLGFHYHEQLPFKKGEKVKISKGTFVHSTNPKHKSNLGRHYGSFYLKRDLWVTIHHFGCGQSVEEHDYLKDYKDIYPDAPIIETQYGLRYATQNPSVIWAGSGGYWHEVDINEVLK